MKFAKVILLALGVLVAGVAGVAVAYAIWPLTVFNLLMPKDPARIIARGVTYGSHPRQNYDIYAPREGEKLPLLIFVHGGSWSMGGKEGYDFVGHAFASRGYLTAMIEYRLVPEVHYPTFVDDTAKAVAHFRAHAAEHGGDASRVYLVGHSAGAYNVVQAALNPAFANDVQSIKAVAGIAGPYAFLADSHPDIIKAFDHYEPFADTQPSNFLRPDQPPIILLHGLDDDIVNSASSVRFEQSLMQAQATVELKLQPNTNHISILGDLSRPFRYRSTTFEDIIAFFAKYR